MTLFLSQLITNIVAISIWQDSVESSKKGVTCPLIIRLTKVLKEALNTSSVPAQSVSVAWLRPSGSRGLDLDAGGMLFPMHAAFFLFSSQLCVSIRCGLTKAIIFSQAGYWCVSSTQDEAHTWKHTRVQTCAGSLRVRVLLQFDSCAGFLHGSAHTWEVTAWLCTNAVLMVPSQPEQSKQFWLSGEHVQVLWK